MAQPEDLNSSLIANCVFNALLTCAAIMLNIITILALRKTSSLPTPLKTLLLHLTVSDLGVGLLVQPLYIAHLVMTIEENTETQTYKITLDAFAVTANFLFYASFIGVVTLSADRFLAIHLHLRYREFVTRKRVVAVVMSVWVFSAIFPPIFFFSWIPNNVSAIAAGTIEGVCYITTVLLNFNIYLAIRHHSNQIHVLQSQLGQNHEMIANAARQRKSAVTTFCVCFVFLVCYLPGTCIWIVVKGTGRNTVTRHLEFYADTLLFLNSSLNPLMYCWKMRHIRHAAIQIVQNIFPRHN